eukprot:362460-Chlamydomonas_euryale.AAC.3
MARAVTAAAAGPVREAWSNAARKVCTFDTPIVRCPGHQPRCHCRCAMGVGVRWIEAVNWRRAPRACRRCQPRLPANGHIREIAAHAARRSAAPRRPKKATAAAGRTAK